MKFVFVRHGEATHNVAFRETKNISVFADEAHFDALLTDAGIAQARELGIRLATEYPGSVKIWSSPSTRTIQTSEELFEEMDCGMRIVLHDGLLEFQDAHHKCNTRRSRTELEQKFEVCDYRFLPETPPVWLQTELQIATRNRMKMVLQTIADVEHNSDIVIVVSHKNSLHSLLGRDFGNCEFVEKTFEEVMGYSSFSS